MSGFNIRDTVKKGWHPNGSDGKSKESWRGDFKGLDQVSGWMGKSKNQTDPDTSGYVARPLSSLKDPSSFAPPPKRLSYSGLQSANNTTTSMGFQGGLTASDSQQMPEDPEEPRPPMQSYSKDTTGLSTSHLPPPPGRRDNADGRASVPKSKPSLPPRLPPRQNESPRYGTPPSAPTYHESTPEPPAHRGILNQDSLNRLGAAGVNVPGFDIGSKALKPVPKQAPPVPSRKPTISPSNQYPSNDSQMNTLQTRLAQLETSHPKQEPIAQGTTWAEKQSALKTASSFKNNPSSVSFSDARNAASTFNSFRERHSAQVASGLKSANALNSKYELTDKAASYYTPDKQNEPEHNHGPISMEDNTIISVKKPPPPPKKKPGLGAIVDSSG